MSQNAKPIYGRDRQISKLFAHNLAKYQYFSMKVALYD